MSVEYKEINLIIKCQLVDKSPDVRKQDYFIQKFKNQISKLKLNESNLLIMISDVFDA